MAADESKHPVAGAAIKAMDKMIEVGERAQDAISGIGGRADEGMERSKQAASSESHKQQRAVQQAEHDARDAGGGLMATIGVMATNIKQAVTADRDENVNKVRGQGIMDNATDKARQARGKAQECVEGEMGQEARRAAGDTADEGKGLLKSISDRIVPPAEELRYRNEEEFEVFRHKEDDEAPGDRVYDRAKAKGAELYDRAKEKGSEVYDRATEKGGEEYDRAGETYDRAMARGEEEYDRAKDKSGEVYGRVKAKGEEAIRSSKDKAVGSGCGAAERARSGGTEAIDRARSTGEEAKQRAKEAYEEVKEGKAGLLDAIGDMVSDMRDSLTLTSSSAPVQSVSRKDVEQQRTVAAGRGKAEEQHH